MLFSGLPDFAVGQDRGLVALRLSVGERIDAGRVFLQPRWGYSEIAVVLGSGLGEFAVVLFSGTQDFAGVQDRGVGESGVVVCAGILLFSVRKSLLRREPM